MDGIQQDLFVTADQLPKSIGHVFYRKLNELLAEAGFDRWVEDLCGPYYSQGKGRPGIPPGVYFRMLIVGYFEGIQSCRGIAWRCADSLSLRSFLGIPLVEDTPDHSSMIHLLERLSHEVLQAVFTWVFKLAREKQLLKGRTVDLDSNLIMAAEVYQGNQADVSTLEDSVNAAQTNQAATGSDVVNQEVVADKG